MNLEQRTQGLLALVDAYRLQRRREIVDPALEQSRAMVKAALGEARSRVHTAAAEARARVQAQVAAARAALQTQQRVAAQRSALAKLSLAWAALVQALQQRWRAPESRRRWVAHALQTAQAALAPGAWRIEHPADWPDEEGAQAAATLRLGGVAEVRLETDPGIAAGLRIRAGHNVLDFTLDGLLADRAALEGRLLEALAAVPPAPGSALPAPGAQMKDKA